MNCYAPSRLTLRTNGLYYAATYRQLQPTWEVGLGEVLHEATIFTVCDQRRAKQSMDLRKLHARANAGGRAVLGAGAENLSDAAPFAEPDGDAWVVEPKVKEVASVSDTAGLAEPTEHNGLLNIERDAANGELTVRNGRELRCQCGRGQHECK